ncbi:MAG: MFS transporter [Nocardioidaceae bacterium]|nr:MFS transporter [Nocardioidaceae bacterium]
MSAELRAAEVPPSHAEIQRRTIATLVVTQALGGVGVSTGIAVSSLLAAEIVDDETLAGLPQTAQVVGAALAAFAMARVMSLRGRRPGLALGYGVGAVGAGLCVLSAVVGSFAVLLLGTLLLGSATGANSQARYAATDLAEPRVRARALSIVVWATTVGAVLGPNLVGPAGVWAERVGLPELSGAFVLGLVGLVASVLVLTVWLRPDPLLVARSAAESRGETTDHHVNVRRVLGVLAVTPRAAAAVAAMALAHTVMVSVMVMTPLHMDHGGASLRIVGFVISMHVLGMFAFSPLVGWLADRVGRVAVLAAGAVVLLVAVVLAGRTPDGASATLTWALFLLGLGWSLALISSSALLVDAVSFSERPGVQGAADLMMGLSAAAGGALAGVVVGVWGFGTLNAAAAVLSVLVLVAAAVARADASDTSDTSDTGASEPSDASGTSASRRV